MRLFFAAIIVGLLCFAAPAVAQTPATVKLCQGNPCVSVSPAAPQKVTGSFAATISGFAPGGTFASLTATASSASVALPAGVVVAFQNTGTTSVSCTLGIGSATAVAGQLQVTPNSTVFITVGSNTFGACIDETGSASNVIRLAGGAGLGTGYGGSSGGGGGAVSIAAGADVTTGNTTDGACAGDATSGCTVESRLIRIAQNLSTVNTTAAAAVPTGANVIGQVGSTSQYPFGAVPLTASATGTTATLAASASIKTYICGFSIRANATAAATANSTVTGTITGTLNYTQWTAPAASGLGITEQIFAPCIPSSAINTAIAVISAAPGTGGVVSVSAWGYQL